MASESSLGCLLGHTLRGASAALFAAVALAACGGGGDDPPASTTPNFAGTYSGTFNKTQDSCSTTAAATFTGEDTITQAGRDMTLVSGADTLRGTVDADNQGFTLTGKTVVGAVTANSTVTFRAQAAANTFQEQIKVDTSSTTSTRVCTLVYTALVTRR